MGERNERWGVIINPYSGKRQLEKDWVKIYMLLKKAEINFSEQRTTHAGHAIELAKTMVEQGFRYLLVVGGDGTLNEVVNGVYLADVPDKSDVTLALVPYGTGNDWARYWGIPTKRRKKLSEQLLKRKSVKVDIGKISYTDEAGNADVRYFLNGAGWGFDGTVVRLTNLLKTVLGGSAWVYSLAVILTCFRLRNHRMQLSHDGQTIDRDILTIAIGNSCFSGGGLRQVPDAVPTDGLLHVVALEKLKIREVISAVRLLFSGKLPKHHRAHAFATTKMTFDYIDKIDAETDGVDLEVARHAVIEVVPQALNMLVP